MADNLRDIVFSNLDASKENGYFEPGEQLHGSNATEIAWDMLAYAADLEHVDEIADIIPHIEAWMEKNNVPKTKQD